MRRRATPLNSGFEGSCPPDLLLSACASPAGLITHAGQSIKAEGTRPRRPHA